MPLQDISTNSLREKFLSFFEQKGHKILPSSSLLPENDASVLFTTAGMQQFKRFYDRPDEAPAAAVTTCQKCIRTGDIEEVGDETHVTLLEMLGNFSFGYPEKKGSYFKKEAIEMAWEFLTDELQIDKSRISCTYFAGDKGISEDHESHELLKQITGIEDARILGTGFDETFWSLGTEGSPGGPTVEFYIDGIEIWNLVFNQYKFENGHYVASQFKGVDTGMGLERLVAVLNNVDNVYQTDLFEKSHKKLHELLKTESLIDERIILDHIRAASFMINEDIEPANKGGGYVLRRLIRRAVVRAGNLKIDHNFTVELANEVVKTYSNYDLDLKKIEAVLETEETKFRKGLESGLKLISSQDEFSGKVLFDLYQTYGVPVEVSLEEAKDLDKNVSEDALMEYQKLLSGHQEKSRTASAGMFKGGLEGGGEQVTKYHTATHLLLAALRQVLGDHVFQKGSNITPERLRFDFSFSEKMTDAQIKKVEDIVNEKIKDALPVKMEEMPVFEAKNSGAMGVFDEKYAENVKVYSIGDYSREICGGPHATNTSELGRFKILKEESSSSGVRRIKAILE
jgi:alanyl-tRNA synthetase